MLPYTTTKHAVVGLSTALRAEAAAVGVHVSVLCPGFVDTPLLDSIHTGGPDGDQVLSMRRRIRRIQPRLMTADLVAERAIRGLERDTAIIAVGGTAQVLWRLNRYVPPVARGLVRLQASGARRMLPKADRPGR